MKLVHPLSISIPFRHGMVPIFTLVAPVASDGSSPEIPFTTRFTLSCNNPMVTSTGSSASSCTTTTSSSASSTGSSGSRTASCATATNKMTNSGTNSLPYQI
eukprot:3478707-Rhodomonas_salina.2